MFAADFQVFSLNGALISAAFLFAGIVDAACGGGGLITIPVFLATGFPVHKMIGTTQCSILIGTIAALAEFAKKKLVHWRSALMTLPFSIYGAICGARLNLLLSEETLRTVMMILLPVITALTLIRRNFGQENQIAELSNARVLAASCLMGSVIGAYQAFYGAGAGLLFMLAFVFLDRLDLVTASGNTKLVALVSITASSITYALSGAVLWPVVACLTVTYGIGCFIGARLAVRGGDKLIRPMFYVVLAGLFLQLILERL